MSAMAVEDEFDEEPETEEYAAVVDADSMPNNIFIKHINSRHCPIATLTHLDEERDRETSGATRVLRAYHERCHALGVPHGVFGGHYHTEGQFHE